MVEEKLLTKEELLNYDKELKMIDDASKGVDFLNEAMEKYIWKLIMDAGKPMGPDCKKELKYSPEGLEKLKDRIGELVFYFNMAFNQWVFSGNEEFVPLYNRVIDLAFETGFFVEINKE